MRFLSFIIFLSVTFLSYATTIEVCATCSVKTIKEAVKKAEDGNTILAKKGVDKEYEIYIDKSITLKAEPGVVIDGESKGEILVAEADGFKIDGFEFINVGTSFQRDYAAVRVKNSKEFVVENLKITKPYWAIYIERSNNGIIRNNQVYGEAVTEYNSANGIQLWYSHGNHIENNVVHRMRDGIYFEFSDKNTIVGNVSQDNVRYGLHFMFCHDNEVERNLFKHNGAGIAIMFSKRMDAHHNTFEDNWGGSAYGMLLKEVFDTKLTHNHFHRNTTGVNCEGATRIVFEYNTFQSNGWAINSRGANYDNKLRKNNFINNSFDLAYKGPLNRNEFDGNYWSEYTGYDLDRDGVGDVPHRPIKLFSYIVNRSPEAIILLRSIFIDIVDFSEKVSPVFTPDNLLDNKPSMKMFK